MKRRTFVRLHLWLGLTLGAIWSVQGLTGALLVFHRDLRIGYGALNDAPMAPMGVLLRAAERAAGRPIREIAAIGPDLRVVEARYDAAGGGRALRVEAATGRVIGRGEMEPGSPFAGSGWQWLLILHMNLHGGAVGTTLIGSSGLFLLMSAAIGLGVAWPRKRQWRAAFSFGKWRNLPQKLYGWHRAVGLLAAGGLLLVGVTGAYMTFHTQGAAMLRRLLPFEPAMAAGRVSGSGGAPVSPDGVMAMARARFPEARFTSLQTPAADPGFYFVRLALPDEWRRWSGSARVKVDAGSGAVVAVHDPRRTAAFNRVDDAVFPFHTGEAVGVGGRLLVFLAGLSVPFFYATGLMLWLRKRRGAGKKPAR